LYYHFCIILTFYPLTNLLFLDSKISAIEVCTDAANAVITLARSYESLHGLRRTPCFLPYIIFASGIIHMGTLDPKIKPVDTLILSRQEVPILQLMSFSHGSSKHAYRILLNLAMHGGSMASSLDGHIDGDRDLDGDRDMDGDVSDPWKPLAMSMIWPLAESSRYTPLLEDLMSGQTLGPADTYREKLRTIGFGKH
jgi:hypothetical protein